MEQELIKKKTNILLRTEPDLIKKIDEMMEYYGQVNRTSFIRYAVNQLFLGDYRKSKYGYNAGFETSRARKREQGVAVNDAERIAELANMDAYSLSEELFKRGYFSEKTLPNGETETYRIIPDEANNFITWIMRFKPGQEEPFYKYILHSNFEELMNGVKKEKKLKI